MKAATQSQALEQASVKQYCKAVRVPVIGANFVALAEQALRENHSHIRYLEALLGDGERGAGRACDREPAAGSATAAAEDA